MTAAMAPLALLMQVGGGLYQGIEDKAAYGRMADAADENGRLALLEGEQDAWETMLEERRATGELIAGLAGSGLAMGTGSAADVIRENAVQRERQILALRRAAVGERNQYALEAREARAKGKNALVKSMFGAVSTALGGFSQMRAARIGAETGAMVRTAERVPRPSVTGGGYRG